MGALTARRPTETVEQQQPSRKQGRELRDAIERVYRRYGTDLNAFYRDAHREAQKEQLEKKAR